MTAEIFPKPGIAAGIKEAVNILAHMTSNFAIEEGDSFEPLDTAIRLKAPQRIRNFRDGCTRLPRQRQ